MLTEHPVAPPRAPRAAAGTDDRSDASDDQLLRLFVAEHDEAAFAALVRRHGPLVLAACRRVLGRAPDAEDAFQATFLVLVRKASSLRRPELLGNWLYGVAYRIARKFRTTAETRKRHEGRKLLPAFVEDEPANDLRPILDEELHKLPEKYRLAVVLCYLEGKTNEEAARQLDWPTGTVKGRLARARDLLRSRLVRRGIALSAAALAIALDETAAHAGALGEAAVRQTVAGALGKVGRDAVVDTAAEGLGAWLWGRVQKGLVTALLALVAVVAVAFAVVSVDQAFGPWLTPWLAPKAVPCGDGGPTAHAVPEPLSVQK